MSTPYNVVADVGAYRTGGSQLASLSDELRQAANELSANAGDLGALGGGDTLGAIAVPIYQAALDIVLECLGELENAVGDHADALATTADHYEETESDNAALARDIVEV